MITNIRSTSVSVSKVWNDGDNADGKRPASVTVDLLRDGVKIDSATIEAGEDGSWTHVFQGLRKYDPADGHEYAYTVTERAVEGYASEVTGDAANGFVITNTKTQTPPPSTPPTTPEKPKGELPQTGDVAHFEGAFAIAGVAVLVTGALVARLASRDEK